MIGIYLLITSPLLVFDLNHNYDNLLMPLRTLFGTQKADLSPFSLINVKSHIHELLSALGRIWFIRLHTNPQDEIVLESHMSKTYGNMYLSWITVFFLGWFFLKNREKGYQIIFISIATIIAAFILYPSYNPEYYLMSLLTLVTVGIGWSLARLPRIVAGSIISIFIIANVLSVVTLSDKYGLITRKSLVEETMKGIGDNSFELQTYGELAKPQFTYAGWRYLFKAYGTTPAKSNIDVVLGWIYPDEISGQEPDLLVVVSDTIPYKSDRKPVAVYQSGPYRAYIFTYPSQ